MDYSEIQQRPSDDCEFLGFDCVNNVRPRKFIVDSMKFSFLNGADKALLSRKSPGKSIEFDSGFHNDISDGSRDKPKNMLLHSSSNQVLDGVFDYTNQYVDISKVTSCPSGGYNEFPLNIIAFLAVLVIKFIGFQMNLFVKFFTIPIWFSYFSIMLSLFPLQTLSGIRKYLMSKILGMWFGLYFSATTFICGRIKAQKSVLDLGIRCGWAAFWAIYVCMLMLAMLVLGFVMGGLTMRWLSEKPIQISETLHFDYTKASPAAFVHIVSPLDGGTVVAAEILGARAIPFNHKLQPSVSLTLPESDYNRELGVFQVKVEFLSANGKISGSSSHPCMLKFKSQPIRVIETVFKSVPLIAGFQSEVQMLNVKINSFIEGHDPTSSLRVTLEQRAEYQSGGGIPEIYSASVSLQSELPQLKKIIWSWRRTIFVWISLMSFTMELLVMLIFCRSMIIPKGWLIVTGAKKHAPKNKITW